jgi:hypothetical protein
MRERSREPGGPAVIAGTTRALTGPLHRRRAEELGAQAAKLLRR